MLVISICKVKVFTAVLLKLCPQNNNTVNSVNTYLDLVRTSFSFPKGYVLTKLYCIIFVKN